MSSTREKMTSQHKQDWVNKYGPASKRANTAQIQGHKVETTLT